MKTMLDFMLIHLLILIFFRHIIISRSKEDTMKKIVSIFLFFAIISIVMMGGSSNSYSGKYITSNNAILELNSTGKCKVINNFYKDVFYTYGQYTISDNEIEIIFDKDKRNYLNVESLKGKVKGSNIVFYDYIQEGKECVYSKIE